MRTPLVVLAGVLVALILFTSVYTVSETEQVIITQFGRPIGGVVDVPGLHLKVRLIQVVHRFVKRWLEFDGDSNEIPTKDKKYIWVDTCPRWRIAGALRFYQAVNDERGGQSRLDDIVNGETRKSIASCNLIEVIRSTNRDFQLTEELEGIASEEITGIETGREKITEQILERASAITPEFGVELVDVRFKRINYTESVQQAVFQRMVEERKRIAERSRSEGQGCAAGVRGQKERDVLAATWIGYRTAEELKAKADAKATDICAQAYGRDRDFYQFSESLERLGASLDKDATTILSTDSELLRYLKGPRGC